MLYSMKKLIYFKSNIYIFSQYGRNLLNVLFIQNKTKIWNMGTLSFIVSIGGLRNALYIFYECARCVTSINQARLT